MGKKYVRVTDLVDYLICPMKVYFKRVLGIEEETREEMLVGSIVHEVLDKLNRREREIVYEILEPMPFEKIYSIYRKFTVDIISEVIEEYEDSLRNLNLDKEKILSEVLTQIEYEIYDRAQNTYSYMINLDIYGVELWDKLTPKLLSEVEVISDKYSLVGRIDRIEDYGDIIVLGEVKTSKSLRSLYLHKIQLAAYLILARENFPRKRIGSTYLYYLKLRKKKEVRVSSNIINRVLEIKDRVLEIIEEEKLPEYKEKKMCSKCYYRNLCVKYFKVKNT